MASLDTLDMQVGADIDEAQQKAATASFLKRLGEVKGNQCALPHLLVACILPEYNLGCRHLVPAMM